MAPRAIQVSANGKGQPTKQTRQSRFGQIFRRRVSICSVPMLGVLIMVMVFMTIMKGGNRLTYAKGDNKSNIISKLAGSPDFYRLSEIIDARYKQLLLFNTSCRQGLSNSTNMKNQTNTVIQNEQQLINLKYVIKQKCYDGKPVPNVVHYVWLGPKKREMKFYQFLSVYSCHKYLHPCLILFHGETLPYGRYWDLLQTVVPNIIHIKRTSPTHIEEIQIKHIEHKADIVRFHALRDNGGIYMDTDSVALRSMDTLRSYNFTLGIENPGNLAIATILSAKDPDFLRIWLMHYITFSPDNWGLHSIILPYRLSKKYPNLIHVEKDYTFYYGGSGAKLVSGKMNWGRMYAMHLSMRYYASIPFNETTIRKMDTTLGEIGRHILFNSKDKCSS